MTPLRVGVIGCGNIAGRYVSDMQRYSEVEVVGATDVDVARAQTFAQEHKIKAYADLDALLADDSIQLVVNLTSHFAHLEITTQALNAGKHVHSEKPLALTFAEASSLVDLARAKGLRLGSSPFTLMGEAQQTAWKLIREGKAGKIRVAYAEVNWGRIEAWHPAPGPFYEVGALFDVGVYPLTILTAMFGPARRVQSYGKVLYPDRVTREGVPFHINTPDFVVSMIELADGTVVRLTTNFYVGHHNKQIGIEFHGDAGSVYLSNWHNFDGEVQYTPYGESYQPVPLLKEAYNGVPWGAGIRDMALAMRDNRPHRFTGEQAAHVVDILESSVKSMQTQAPVSLSSSFTPPAPMEWAV